VDIFAGLGAIALVVFVVAGVVRGAICYWHGARNPRSR
jgi:hypothetical protein